MTEIGILIEIILKKEGIYKILKLESFTVLSPIL